MRKKSGSLQSLTSKGHCIFLATTFLCLLALKIASTEQREDEFHVMLSTVVYLPQLCAHCLGCGIAMVTADTMRKLASTFPLVIRQ